MPTRKNPKHGSMQFWPRKRVKKETGLIRSWAKVNDPIALGFAGYKAGMTHLIATDNKPKSQTKGQDIRVPVTIVECPPLKVMGIRYYKNTPYGLKVVYDKMAQNQDKDLYRKLIKPKKKQENKEFNFDDIMLIVYAQPKLTGIGKKKPEIFELAIGGNKEDKVKYAEEVLGKDIKVTDVFKEGQQVDSHSVTIGKGFQGSVKRCGVSIKQHKAEKAKRVSSPAGSWNRENQTMWRNPKAGKMGYNLRTQYNLQIIKISDDLEGGNPKQGIKRFGKLKNTYVYVKGSIPGVRKRIIRFNRAIRSNKKIPKDAPSINYIHLAGM